MSLLDRIPMPQSGMDSFLTGMNATQEMLARILTGKQNQQRLDQNALHNEQLNQYRMNQLDFEKNMNPLKLDLLKAQIESQKALSKQRSSGMMNSTAQQKDINSLIYQIKKDNPNLNDYQAMNIANSYLSGDMQEGMPEPSGIAQSYINQINKRGTTSQLINQTINAKQAEAELSVLDKYASEWSSPYGDQFLGYSPKQIIDSFSSNKEDQKNLGKLVASNAIQFEMAQIRTRLANGQPGITNTQELMKESMQHINTLFPRLSDAARQSASKALDKALKDGLNARLKVGIDASSATSKKPIDDKNFKSPKTYNDLRNLKDPGEEGYQQGFPKVEKVIEKNGKKLYFFNGKWHEMEEE